MSRSGVPYVFQGTQRFRLVAPLGAGGMGVVFEAYDRENDCSVALKLLPSVGAAAATRFKNEFRALQGINHPNLVGLRELFIDDGQLFFTMELVRGVSIISYAHGMERRDVTALAAAGAGEPTLRNETASQLGAPTSELRLAVTGKLDETRLRSAFGQLARALSALHAHGKVHRDVKPSNVLVTGCGKTVLLDFGLIVDLQRKLSREDFGAGTVSYMSPEQAAGAGLSAASDWYSFGVMLYEALVGRLPFSGSVQSVLARKQSEDAPAPVDSCASLELVALCGELLHRDPSRRPTAQRILSVLLPDVEPVSRPSSFVALGSSFVGRSAELNQLSKALDRIDEKPLVVLIEGESGVGKTALAQEFLGRALAARQADLMVFRGRCSERELVPFKAFDAVAEDIVLQLEDDPQLAQHVARAALTALADAALAFPVLARLFPTSSDLPSRAAVDPHAKRSLAFRGVKRLLEVISRQRRVILAIDDWQWVDADSIALLSAILAPPNTPRTLLLLTCRANVPHHLGDAQAVERLRLDNLSEEDARQLALQLLSRGRAGNTQRLVAQDIAVESTGHPLFIAELVRQLQAEGSPQQVLPRLDDTLWLRFSALEPTLKHATMLLATAGSALPLSDLRESIIQLQGSLSGTDFLHGVARLRDEHFVRSNGLSGVDLVDCFHDRIASAILSRMNPGERRRCHEALAIVFEQHEPRDLEALALHWRAAGDTLRAARYTVLAGDRAMTAVAFERAADFYRLALELEREEEALALAHEKLGDVLSHLGRGREAADAYLAGAATANSERQVDLLRLAADQLFRSGYVDEAVALIDRVFEALELRLPASPRQALLWLAYMRGRVRLRGTSFQARDKSSLLPVQLARVDALWSVAIGLSTVDNLRGAYMQSRHLLMALELGEPFRVLRALAAEAGYQAAAGVACSERVDRLLASADALARDLKDPYAHGFVHLARGISSFLRGHWSSAWRCCEDAVAIFERRPVMASWELASARMFSLWASFYQGDFATTRDRVPELIREAETRGDLYAATSLGLSLCNAAWLIIDDPREARRRLIVADRHWSNVGIHLQHYWSTVAWVNLELYEGNAEAAYEHVMRIRPLLKQALLLRIELVRVELTWLWARTALAVAQSRPAKRARMLAEAEDCGHRLCSERLSWAAAVGMVTLAGVKALNGQREAAHQLLERGEQLAEQQRLRPVVFAARRILAQASGQDAAEAAIPPAIVRADRWTALFAPGFESDPR